MEDLQALAVTVAAEVLPRELERLAEPETRQLVQLCDGEPCEELPVALAKALAPFLMHPPGDATPKLVPGTPEAEARATMELYWRCAVAVGLMPDVSLEALARHHPDLQAHLAAGSSAADRRRLLVQAILPRFSMTCTTREEAEAAERRRRELAELKRQAAIEREAESGAVLPGADKPATSEERGEEAGGATPTDEGVLI